MRFVSASLLFAALIVGASAVPIFQDGFESGELGSAWTTGSTHTGRTAIEIQFGPATGLRHLVLDDSVNDAASSVAEAILQLDLTRRRNVVLSFKAKSLGNEPHPPPAGAITAVREFDAVTVSFDGGTSWRSAQSLANIGTTWESYAIGLDAAATAAGAVYGSDVRIRFSAYDNSPAPLDGIALDDIVVEGDEDQRAVLELPTPLAEGSPPQTGFIVLSIAPAEPLTLALSVSPAGQLSLPATVTVPAGEMAAEFGFSVTDDALVNLTRTVTVTATATGVAATPAGVVISDNETPVVTLELAERVMEGESAQVNSSVSMDLVAGIPLSFTLTATPTGQMSHPSTVTIQPGQTQTRFSVRAIDDAGLDGDVVVTLRAVKDGLPPATGQVTVEDNEMRAIELDFLNPIAEGETRTWWVRLGAIMSTDLTIALTAPEEAGLAMPSTVTIRAGQKETSFQVQAVDDAVPEPTRPFIVTASAATFPSTTRIITVVDNDAAAFQFFQYPDMIQAGEPFGVTIDALDSDGKFLPSFQGSVDLSVVMQDGQSLPLGPSSVAISTGSRRISATVPDIGLSPVRLRATGALGAQGESGLLEVMRAIPLKVGDLAWDEARNRLYASVQSAETGPHANAVVAIDPVTLQVVASVPTGQEPARLLLTSGGERLYVALDASGSVAWIDPVTFTVQSTFAIGRSEAYGQLYANDMASPAGQPSVVVVLRSPRNSSDSSNTVAAFRDGAMLPQATVEDEPNCRAIEASEDPTIFHAFNAYAPAPTWRRLRLGEAGVTWDLDWEANSPWDLGFAFDFKVDGGLGVTTYGALMDPATGRPLGRLTESDSGGQVLPVAALNRVFLFHRGFDHYRYLSVYDTLSHARVKGLSLAWPLYLVDSLIRWGTHGLAFKTFDSVVLVNSNHLVPSPPPADVSVTIRIDPIPTHYLGPLPFAIDVTNSGPGTARGVVVEAAVSAQATNLHLSASQGVALRIGQKAFDGVLGDLAPGVTATLHMTLGRIDTLALGVRATVRSSSFDPVVTNNVAHRWGQEAFPAPADQSRSFYFGANNLVYDERRKLLWTTGADPSVVPAEGWLIAIDPSEGRISESILFPGTAMPRSMALSDNGRYLYFGSNDAGEVLRFDLQQAPPVATRVVLPRDSNGNWQRAGDIEVLDGDGTSFAVTSFERGQVMVIDGIVPRPATPTSHRIDRIARAGGSDTFVGLNISGLPREFTRFSISPSGVDVGLHWDNPLFMLSDIDVAGSWVLDSQGRMFDALSLGELRSFHISGAPCLDAAYGRAYIGSGSSIYGFDAQTGVPLGSRPVTFDSSVSLGPDSILRRWGMDGFATVQAGALVVGRWSQAVPPTVDANANGIPDGWEAVNLGPYGGDLASDLDGDGLPSGLEYVFGTDAGNATADPRHVHTPEPGVVRLVFPRRTGIGAGFYGFEASAPGLDAWAPVSPVRESLLAVQTVDGVPIESVQAEFEFPNAAAAYVRLVWPAR